MVGLGGWVLCKRVLGKTVFLNLNVDYLLFLEMLGKVIHSPQRLDLVRRIAHSSRDGLCLSQAIPEFISRISFVCVDEKCPFDDPDLDSKDPLWLRCLASSQITLCTFIFILYS